MRVKLSQVFLHNENILEKIANACKIKKSDIVFEIGAGKGQLTKYLVKKAKKVIVCEIDKMLVPYLIDLNVKIINKSILKVKIPKTATVIVGNIPYHLSGKITEKILKTNKRAVILYQKEFADRITATRGSRDYSRITVLVQYFSTPKKLFDVDKSNFSPVPKVDSTLVEFIPNKKKYNKEFFDFVKILFQFKNKSVRNALIDGKRMWTTEKDKRKIKPLLEKISNEKVRVLSIKDLEKEYKLFKTIN